MAHLRDNPDDLYQQFIEAQEKYKSVYDLAEEFEKLTSDRFEKIRDLGTKGVLGEDDAIICKKLEVMLSEEKNTWRLAKALINDKLLYSQKVSLNNEHNHELLTDSKSSFHLNMMTTTMNGNISHQNGHSNDHFEDEHMTPVEQRYSDEQLISIYYASNLEVRRMQVVLDWLERNEADIIRDGEDEAEVYDEVFTAWETTFHEMRSRMGDETMGDLDVSLNSTGLELCTAMDPDAPIRSGKPLAYADKEMEMRIFKHLFKHIRAGNLDAAQDLARTVSYQWVCALLDGWLPYCDPNLDAEYSGLETNGHQQIDPSSGGLEDIRGNRKRDVWRKVAFSAARTHGLATFEKAILGVYGGNLKSVLPVCHSWSDQLWARTKCSIDVKVERALRDRRFIPHDDKCLVDMPSEFYDNYQNLGDIFKSIRDSKVASPYKEAVIHETLQEHLILNDIDGLLKQLCDWCTKLDFENNLALSGRVISPQFLRCFTHLVIFVRDLKLITRDDARGTLIIEAYITFLTKQRAVESVAHYTTFLPRENQIMCCAKLLASIDNKNERKRCLDIAKARDLDIDEITQTVVDLIRAECSQTCQMNGSISEIERTKTTPQDQRIIDSLDYLLCLESKNYVAILHHANTQLRIFANQKKMDAVKATFLQLPTDLGASVEKLWRVHTNSDITIRLRNNIRELDCFRCLLEAQEELSQWSDLHHKRPEEPKKPANLSTFCDNVNYEQRCRQFQQDLRLWGDMRQKRTEALTGKILIMFEYPGGWMKDLPIQDNGTVDESTGVQILLPEIQDDERAQQLVRLRKTFIPHMLTICFNVLHLTERYEDCLKVSNLLARDDLKLYDELSKSQICEFLDKISEVTKIIVKSSLGDESLSTK